MPGELPPPVEKPEITPPAALPEEIPVPKPGEGEVQGRGPVHEGFAQPGGVIRPGPIVPKKPPVAIPETPSEHRPEGDNVIWIPGYWSYDEDRNDFLWVSGFWRVVPAGRKWVPGYWAPAGEGYRWVPGMWANARLAQTPYVEAPPESLDRGPVVPAPDEDHSYVPGTWVNRDERWLWQPGFWCPPNPGFVYTPPSYCWTPRGYLFCDGFWDHCLETRGILSAPVWFDRPYWDTPGWSFCPRFTVGLPGFFGSLWIRGGNYCFGDFYGARYAARGFQPWITHGARIRDPLFGYYNGINRGNPNWRRNLLTTHNGRERGLIGLPPRTLAAQERIPLRERDGARIVQPINTVRNDRLRLTRTTNAESVDRRRMAESLRRVETERLREETKPIVRGERPQLALNRVPTPPSKTVPSPTSVTRSLSSPRDRLRSEDPLTMGRERVSSPNLGRPDVKGAPRTLTTPPTDRPRTTLERDPKNTSPKGIESRPPPPPTSRPPVTSTPSPGNLGSPRSLPPVRSTPPALSPPSTRSNPTARSMPPIQRNMPSMPRMPAGMPNYRANPGGSIRMPQAAPRYNPAPRTATMPAPSRRR
jgi:hypothetical protein